MIRIIAAILVFIVRFNYYLSKIFDRRAEYRPDEEYDMAEFQSRNHENRNKLIAGGVSTRAANALARAASPSFPVTDPDALSELQPDQIRSVRNIGDKSMKEIQAFLASREEKRE
jgi:hypothetical protein